MRTTTMTTTSPISRPPAPVCEEEIVFDEDTLESGEIRCPNCGEKLEFDLAHPPPPPHGGEQEEQKKQLKRRGGQQSGKVF